MDSITEAIDEEVEGEESGENDVLKTRGPSLRKAINMHCRECIYDQLAKGLGTWREQVGGCTVTKCALWPVRPTSKPRKVKEDSEITDKDTEHEQGTD